MSIEDRDFEKIVEERIADENFEFDVGTLCFCAGYRCAFADDEVDCERLFPNDDGDIYHIESMNPEDGRFNKNLTREGYNDVSNLILLCPQHRRLVDFDLEYSVKDLYDMRARRERQTFSRLKTDEGKKFLGELSNIFEKYDFDQLLWRQNYDYYISSDVDERMLSGSRDIFSLCQEGRQWDIPEGIVNKLASFAHDLEELREHLRSYGEVKLNGSYIALMKDCDSEEAETTRQKLAKLRKTYDALRLRRKDLQ